MWQFSPPLPTLLSESVEQETETVYIFHGRYHPSHLRDSILIRLYISCYFRGPKKMEKDLANPWEVPAELAKRWKMEGHVCFFQNVETKGLYSPATNCFPGKPQISMARMGFLFTFIIIFGTSLVRWFLLNFNLPHVASYLAKFPAKNKICLSTNILILTLLPASMLVTRLGNHV